MYNLSDCLHLEKMSNEKVYYNFPPLMGLKQFECILSFNLIRRGCCFLSNFPNMLNIEIKIETGILSFITYCKIQKLNKRFFFSVRIFT